MTPLTVYFDTLWEEAFIVRRPAYLARRFEKRILQRADSRFAITEFAVEHLQRKHGVRVELLPHTLDVTGMANGLTPMPADAPVVVHFAGSIYSKMNTDSLVRLSVGVESVRDLIDDLEAALAAV